MQYKKQEERDNEENLRLGRSNNTTTIPSTTTSQYYLVMHIAIVVYIVLTALKVKEPYQEDILEKPHTWYILIRKTEVDNLSIFTAELRA